MKQALQIMVGLCCGIMTAYSVAPAAHGQWLNEDEFYRLHDELQPQADEPWLSVPWQISLLEAQRVAAQQQKPIFIWAMDGHPLGCT